MSKVGGTSNKMLDTVVNDGNETEGAEETRKGHFEDRTFKSVDGKPPTSGNGVARINLVWVDEDGKVDPDVKASPGGSGGTGSKSRTGADMKDLPGDELLARFRAGDKTLLEGLKGENAQVLLMKIQDALNLENRMFSLMSNIQNAEHETKKAIINNMRA
ncbi:MAG: hypothetical protein HY897_15200 [Deltaproteobacteria bacterium]|nr:hypothetical protein [Deltaproteobacteria bacterium]